MALSDQHILRHIQEWTRRYIEGGDGGGGGHSGVSLNIYAALLGEPPRRIAELILGNKVSFPTKTERYVTPEGPPQLVGGRRKIFPTPVRDVTYTHVTVPCLIPDT